MAQFVFPAVLYKDHEGRGYTIVLHDINVFTEGETVEEAFLRAKDLLLAYCRCAIKYNGEIDSATPFASVHTEAKNIVLLVDTELNDVKIKPQTEAFSLA